LNIFLSFPDELQLIHLLGIILSGSPYSVYDEVSPHVDPIVFDLGVPILGICYGLQVSFPSSQSEPLEMVNLGNSLESWRRSTEG
jgi:hypothetical protein